MLLEEFGEFALTLAELLYIGIGVGKGIVHLVVLFQPVDNLLYCFLNHLLDGLAVVKLWLLLKVADTISRRENHLALIVLVDTCNDFQQARLAATVETDDAYLGTVEKT